MQRAGTLARAKGVLSSLMQDAYLARESAALLSFSGDAVSLRCPPRRAPVSAQAWVAPIVGGGGTPLAAAMRALDGLLRRWAAPRTVVWLLTDGRTAEQPLRPRGANEFVVVDFESRTGALGRATRLAQALDARYLHWTDAWRPA